MNKGRVALSIILGFVVSYAGKTYWAPAETTLDVKSQANLMKVASEVNRTLPIMVDKETELAATIGMQNVFVYNYRLVNHSVQNIDPQKFGEIMKPNITNYACTTPETKNQFLTKGITLRYSYMDKDRKHITSIDVTPTDCKV